MKPLSFSKTQIEKTKLVLITSFIAGILTHGEMIFNKISMHDDISLFISSAGLEQGRWVGRLYDIVLRKLFGEKFSVPVFSGLLSILFIAKCTYLLVDLFKIKEKQYVILLTIIMVVAPSVTHTFMYMQIAPVNFLAVFMVVLACWLTVNYRWGWVISVFLIAISCGIYQGYISFYFAILLLFGIRTALIDLHEFKRLILSGVGVSGAGIIVYMMGLKYYEAVKGVKATYMGMEHVAELNLAGRLSSIGKCYADYLEILNNKNLDLQTTNLMTVIYRMVFIFLIVCFVSYIWKYRKENAISLLLAIACFVILPIGTNAIYILGTSETQVTMVGLYPMVVSLIAIPVILNWSELDEVTACSKSMKDVLKPQRILRYGACIALSLLCLNYVYMSNATYMRLSFLQEKLIAYQTTMVTQIKSVEGYRDEYPVIWVGEGKLKDLSTAENPRWDSVNMGYARDSFEQMLSNYAWKTFMKEHVGYNPESVLPDEALGVVQTEIDDMPCYPDEGSIAVINEYVVIKLGEDEE